MLGLAMFLLKCPSVLQFDRKARGQDENPEFLRNLQTLFGVGRVHSDTAIRERLDRTDPAALRDAFRTVLFPLQRGKGLEHFTVLDGHFLLSVDGTEYFNSSQVHYPSCRSRKHWNGTVTYYHQMLGTALDHPDVGPVFPLALEAIRKQDGASKNDCERTAASRFIEAFRRDRPHLMNIVPQDGAGFEWPPPYQAAPGP